MSTNADDCGARSPAGANVAGTASLFEKES